MVKKHQFKMPNGDWEGKVAVKTFQCDQIPMAAPFIGGGGTCEEYGLCFPGKNTFDVKTVNIFC